jgi:hypothetical protein
MLANEELIRIEAMIRRIRIAKTRTTFPSRMQRMFCLYRYSSAVTSPIVLVLVVVLVLDL